MKEADTCHSTQLNKLFQECTNKTFSDANPLKPTEKMKCLKLGKRERTANPANPPSNN